jgi:hypothetical protein
LRPPCFYGERIEEKKKAPLTWAEFHDGTVYLVLDDFGELGSAYRETGGIAFGSTTVI